MARVDLECGCGHRFFVSDAQLSPQRTAVCPACDGSVKAAGASKTTAPRSAAKAAPPAPERLPVGRSPDARRKWILMGVAAAAAVAVIGIILAVVLSGPKVDYEKEAAKAVEARRRAFEEMSAGSSDPGPAPKSPAPGKPAAPVSPKGPSSELRPKVPPSAAPAAPPSAPLPAVPTPKTSVAISPETLQRVRTEVLALHPFYRSLVVAPDEKARLDAILAIGQGTPEDSEFLLAILGGARLKAVRDEAAQVAQTLPTVDREAQEGLPTDRVTLSDGRVLNCRILDEGSEVVKVSRTLSGSVGGILPLRRESIVRIEKGKGIGTDFAARWESARKGTLAGLVDLLVWSKDNALSGQAKLVAYTILRVDPSNTQARAEAGLPADPIKNAEDVARGAVVSYQGRSWAVKELKEKLLKDGYTLLDGQWYSKKEKLVSVPGLFRYERQNDKPVNFGGGGLLCHETEITYRTVQDPNTNSFTESQDVKLLRRFYAPPMTVALSPRIPPGIVAPPSTWELDVRLNIDEGTPPAGTPMKGEVTMNVPVGAPLLEASVITTAEVKAGGSITVYHTTGSGDSEKRTKLYLCEARETQSHVIPPELVRGLTEVNLVAVLEAPAAYIQKVEKRHARSAVMRGKSQIAPAVDIVHYRQIPDYKAILFPSNSNTIEVFRLKAVVGEPAPQLTKLFAGCPEVLK